jgi:acylglycerol lipase
MAGQSLGALIAASAVAREQSSFRGLLLFSALLDVEMTPILRVQNALGGPLSALLPWARIVPAVRLEDMSEDPEVRHDDDEIDESVVRHDQRAGHGQECVMGVDIAAVACLSMRVGPGSGC